MLRQSMWWVGRVKFPEYNHYEGVLINIISNHEGLGMGVKFPDKKRFVTLEWPQEAGKQSRLMFTVSTK